MYTYKNTNHIKCFCSYYKNIFAIKEIFYTFAQ